MPLQTQLPIFHENADIKPKKPIFIKLAGDETETEGIYYYKLSGLLRIVLKNSFQLMTFQH